jgi:hypothetical protein
MPTTLPLAYISDLDPPLLSWRSARLSVLALPPVFMLLLNLALAGCERHSLRGMEKAIGTRINLVACVEIAVCGSAGLTSIRKIRRR